MKRLHPNQRCALSAIGLIAVCFTGCHSQQTALSNPFMAPDRVPPPATRVVAPGAAQPYYPGDPLPAAHASTTPATPTIATAPAATPSPTPAAKPSSALAFSNERTVSVPADDSSLRFALPPPPANTVVTSPPITPPTEVATAPTVQLATQPSPMPAPVIPASYTGDDQNRAVLASAVEPAATSPWRTPQISTPSKASAPAINASPTLAAAVPPQLAPQVAGPQIPVTLRAVPSPAADIAFSQPPRIRFPSYDATAQTAVVANGNSVQPAAFVAPPTGIAQQSMPQPVVPQTLSVTELPSSGVVPGLGPTIMPTLSVAAQPPSLSSSVVSPDGFRPRSTMR
ncbi:MAG TPA: hypothetical protein VGM76_18105 [Lacipirellulaceae bacterium]